MKTPKFTSVDVGMSRRRFMQVSAISAALASAPGRVMAGEVNRPQVLVLGAGLAGLNAAITLEDAGFDVRVLEGTNRIGGRLYTAPESEVPGHPEIGGSGIGSNYARLIYTAERFGVELEESRPRTEARRGEVMYHVRGKGILADEWAEHSLNPFTQEQYRKTPLHVMQFAIYGDNPLPKGDLEAWHSGKFGDYDISVYQYLVNKGVNPQAIALGAGTNMSYGSNPHDLSMLMGFQSTNLFRMVAPAGGQSSSPRAGVGGNQRIPEAMARNVKGDIILNAHINAIRSGSDGVSVTTLDGKEYKAQFCICTLPFSALRHVRVEPYLENQQAEAVHTLQYTPVFQIHFVPTKEFWLQDKLPPSMWTDRYAGRFMALKNDPANPDKVTSYIAFVNGDMAKYLDRLPEEQAVKTVLDDLAAIRPATRGALKPVKVWSWNRNPFAGGAYAYWQPGQITRFAGNFSAPWQRIHFAGEHTAVMNRGMEGAMESGERAAFEVMDLIV